MSTIAMRAMSGHKRERARAQSGNWSRGLAAVLCAAFAVAVRAETAAPVEPQLEEIIVTAQKRAESMQDVPIAVTAVGGLTLDEFNVKRFDELPLPGVHIGQGARNENLFVRGVGSGPNFGFEQSVPIYIDGVYFGRARSENIAFLDLGQIEVLKGPQPTYLGKNAIAGAVNIRTRRPTDKFEASADITEEFEARETTLSGTMSGPLGDQVRGRVALKYQDMSGWMHNTLLDRREPGVQSLSARASADWDVSDSVKVFAKLEHAKADQDGRNLELVQCGVVNPDAAATRVDPAFEDCKFNDTLAAGILDPTRHPQVALRGKSNYLSTLKLDGGQVNIDWSFAGYQLTSTTAYYKQDFAIPQNDTDATSSDIGIIATTDNTRQTSEELRLLSPRGQRVEWVAGAYADKIDLTTSGIGDLYLIYPATGPIPTPALFQSADQQEKSWALFGELSVQLADPVKLSVGGRYSSVKKDVTINMASKLILDDSTLVDVPFFLFPPFTFVDQRTDSKFQPAVTLEWRPRQGAMLYASYKEGFKSGGYDQDSVTMPASGTLAFRPEQARSYELGAKLTFLDGAARLNMTVFQSDFRDLQVSVFTGTIGFITSNAARARSRGLELDGAWAATNNLTLSADLTRLDAHYTDYAGAACYTGQPVATGACVEVTPGQFAQDMSGATLQFAPTWSGNLGIEYHRPLDVSLFGSNLKLSTRIDGFFTDKYTTGVDRDPLKAQKGFGKLDARIALASQDDRWQLALIGRDLTDEYTTHWVENAVMGPFATGAAYQAFLDRTRQIALQFGVKL